MRQMDKQLGVVGLKKEFYVGVPSNNLKGMVYKQKSRGPRTEVVVPWTTGRTIRKRFTLL